MQVRTCGDRWRSAAYRAWQPRNRAPAIWCCTPPPRSLSVQRATGDSRVTAGQRPQAATRRASYGFPTVGDLSGGLSDPDLDRMNSANPVGMQLAADLACQVAR